MDGTELEVTYERSIDGIFCEEREHNLFLYMLSFAVHRRLSEMPIVSLEVLAKVQRSLKVVGNNVIASNRDQRADYATLSHFAPIFAIPSETTK